MPLSDWSPGRSQWLESRKESALGCAVSRSARCGDDQSLHNPCRTLKMGDKWPLPIRNPNSQGVGPPEAFVVPKCFFGGENCC